MTIEQIAREIQKELKCPLTMTSPLANGPDFQSLLELEWCRIFARHAMSEDEVDCCESIRDFADAAPPFICDVLGNKENGVRILQNIRERVKGARDEYARGAGRIGSLAFMKPSEHGKHYINAQHTDLIRKSRNGISLFYKDWESEELRARLILWFDNLAAIILCPEDHGQHLYLEAYQKQMTAKLPSNPHSGFWKDFLAGSRRRVVAGSCKSEYGASNGQATRCICFDVDFSASCVHGYPIDEQSGREIMGEVGILYQGY